MAADLHFSRFLPYIKTFTVLTFNLGWLILAILLYLNGTSKYANVIEHETGEWGKGAIVDFVATNYQGCPDGYEMITGTFSGTETYCPTSTFGKGDGYSRGKCSSKSKKTTHYGLAPVPLKLFDGNYFCVKRDPELNYHNLALLRTAGDCSGDSLCGSPSDKDRKFCLKNGKKCPLNALYTLRAGQSINSELKSEKAMMNNNWNGFKVYNHQSNSLMVDLRVRLSKPCGNAQQDYNTRKYPISDLYKDPKSCSYKSADGLS
jgi:hypothetical protein